MKEFTMQRVREMKPWSDVELYAYGVACAKYANAMAEFESFAGKKPMPQHKGMPNFKAILADELRKNSRVSKAKTATPVT